MPEIHASHRLFLSFVLTQKKGNKEKVKTREKSLQNFTSLAAHSMTRPSRGNRTDSDRRMCGPVTPKFAETNVGGRSLPLVLRRDFSQVIFAA